MNEFPMGATTQSGWDFSKAGIRWDNLSQMQLLTLDPTLPPSEQARIRRYREKWNQYEGFHWEDIPDQDKPQITLNYCRRFVDKFTSFIFGLYDAKEAGFTLKVPTEMETITLPFLNSVWDADYNDRKKIAFEFGQNASVTGDGFLFVRYEKAGVDFSDPFEENPNGRIKIRVVPSHVCFPVYNPSDKDDMLGMVIKYPITRKEEKGVLRSIGRSIFGRHNPSISRYVIYKQVWTKETFQEWEGDELVNEGPNPYGAIPYVHVPNILIGTAPHGVSDIEDVAPINKEINFKTSDNSEIIEYHSAPVTIVYGAKVASLERGANKIWGNLPKDAKVENLAMQGDLQASTGHIEQLKATMKEIGSMPTSALGGDQAISNTSGVALQIINMPLLERTGMKRITYSRGLRQVSRLVLLIGYKHDLIKIPTKIEGKGVANALGNDVPDTSSASAITVTASSKDTNTSVTGTVTDYTTIRRMFFDVNIEFPSSLPKDKLLELEQIQTEMALHLENRTGAMKRLGRENIEQKLAEIDREAEEQAKKEIEKAAMLASLTPSASMATPRPKNNQIVSGFNNGPEPK